MACDADTGEADCLAEWCADDDWCGLACAVDAIGNKWDAVVVATLLDDGAMRFNGLAAAIPPVTNKTLSAALDDLAADGLVERDVLDEKPVAVEYSLTERGRALRPVISALREWGSEHGKSPEADAATVEPE
ncbi:MAG: winged helix-turn-helix transcriptional regulator [Halobacterium sp.]